MYLTRNQAYGFPYRGFESHPLRQNKKALDPSRAFLFLPPVHVVAHVVVHVVAHADLLVCLQYVAAESVAWAYCICCGLVGLAWTVL